MKTFKRRIIVYAHKEARNLGVQMVLVRNGIYFPDRQMEPSFSDGIKGITRTQAIRTRTVIWTLKPIGLDRLSRKDIP